MVERSHTVSTAAAAIIRLINSSPRSPRQDEIEAVLAKAMAPQPMASPTPSAMPPLSPEHLQYREAIAEIARNEKAPPGLSDEESDAFHGRLAEQEMALARKIWATPAKTLADVLLRAEVALHNENGIMENLDDPEAYYCERSAAQLIQAVIDVLGGADHAR